MRILLLLLTWSLVAGAAWARPRELVVIIPVAQGKFPPAWTDSIRVSLVDDEDMIFDHRHFKKGSSEFRALLSGAMPKREYVVEAMCLGKNGKPMLIYQQKIKLKPDTKKIELSELKKVFNH